MRMKLLFRAYEILNARLHFFEPQVGQRVFDAFAGGEDHSRSAYGSGGYIFGNEFALAADAYAKAAQFAQPDGITVGQRAGHHVDQGIEYGADIGAAHGTDLLNVTSQSRQEPL